MLGVGLDLSLSRRLGGAAAVVPPYEPLGAVFDGVSDYLSLASLVGAVNTKKTLTMAMWVRPAWTIGTSDARPFIFGGGGGGSEGFQFLRGFGGSAGLIAQGYNPSNVIKAVANTNENTFTAQVYKHLMISFDLSDSNKRHLCVDGAVVSGAGWPVFTNDFLKMVGLIYIGRRSNGDLAPGTYAECFVHDSYIDLSQQANREKFILGTNPVDPGEDGSIPFGVQPLVYLSVRPGGVASDFAVNRGSGGNFTVTGALALGSQVILGT